MDQTEKNVQTLYSMGFVDIEEIRNALRISHNDLSEAVAILTNDQVRYGPYTSAGTSEDVEMKDVTSTALVPTAAPPPYNSLPDAKVIGRSGSVCTLFVVLTRVARFFFSPLSLLLYVFPLLSSPALQFVLARRAGSQEKNPGV